MSKIEEFFNEQGFDTKIGRVYPECRVRELIQIVRDECKNDICHRLRYEFEGAMSIDSVESFIDSPSLTAEQMKG